jgi:IS4 transposase
LRGRELCAGLQAGEVVIFDRAYINFDHLDDLDQRDVQWVERQKKRTACEIIESMETIGDILIVEFIVLNQGLIVRRITAWVEVDGKQRKVDFVTNNRQLSVQTIINLYKASWHIEVFFNQINQTLKLRDFLGHSANAMQW